MKKHCGFLLFVSLLLTVPLHAVETYRLPHHDVTVTSLTEPSGSVVLVFDFEQLDEDVFLRVIHPGTPQAQLRIWTNGPLETLACITRELGEIITTAIVDSYLAKQACSATSAIALALTAYSCLSIPAPAATLGCINGLAKLISCSLVNCEGLHMEW